MEKGNQEGVAVQNIKIILIMTRKADKTQWIRAKVVVFFGLNNQFVGMYLVDNKKQVELISKLVYDFPYYCKIYDDIPRLEESLKFTMDGATGDVITHITDIDGVEKNVPRNATMLMETKEELFKRIEELFGSS